MRRLTVCVSVVLAVGLGACLAAAQQSQPPGASVRETVVTAKLDRIDKWGRTVTFKSPDGVVQVVAVPPELTIFDELRTGDLVKVRFRESYIVQVKPGAKLEDVADTTASARAERPNPEDQVLQQLTMTVRIDSVEPANGTVIYVTSDNRKVMRTVLDRKLLEGVKPGDVVTVTFTRERAVSVEHVR
jgi:hypothetical protein